MIKNEHSIVFGDALQTESSLRKKKEIELKIPREDIESYEGNGWEVKKLYKNGSAIVTRRKPVRDELIDRLWTVFYKMGFLYMNSESVSFEIQNEYHNRDIKIDVMAVDDETCLFIQCFAEEELNRVTSFSETISDISTAFKYMCNDVRREYGDRKCKFILATQNYVMFESDVLTARNAGIILFDEEATDYYEALVDHLGSAARYQLLGNLFSKTVIKGMDERVPAIEGKMGDLTYYAFLIEPERLLKIGYVLHRSKANRDQMPTYQRLIKKERLKSIREYVNQGGFFPNSLIISIDSKDGKLRFEKAQQSLQTEHSKIGMLYLPKVYQSAYIIDGQHRLYGYSDSRFADKDTLPVIAFVDLDKEKQVKMFMDINENQKPVSKTLRNILNIDLNWSSDNLSKRREAVILYICQELGENPNSPLFGRVLTGEDTINERRCITIEYLKTAIEKTPFFNKYNKKNEIVERGLLDRINSEETFDIAYNYIRNCLQVIADICKEEWEKGSNGFLTINNTMVGVIRVLGDISSIIYKQKSYDINSIDITVMYNDAAELLLAFCETINTLPADKRNEIKTAKGGQAKETAWRVLQVALNSVNKEFTNDDLEKYIEENCTNYNDEALEEILATKEMLVSKVKVKVLGMIDWENMAFPEDLYIKLNQKVTAQNIKNNRAGVQKKVTLWDVIEFEDICKILAHKSNWTTIFKPIFTVNGEPFTKTEAISKLKNEQAIESKINNGKQITKTEYKQVHETFAVLNGVSNQWNQF